MAGTGSTSIRSYNFFQSSTIGGTGLYTDAVNALPFVDDDSGVIFTSHTIQLINDSANSIFFRVAPDPGAGPDHGEVKPGEALTQDFRRLKQLFVRGTAGDAYRFWAW